MGIINYTRGDVPFLTSYEPYSPINGSVVCDYVEEMLSFDLRSLPVPTEISYMVGAASSYVTTLKIKNITLNASLNVTVEFDKNVFIINGEQLTNKINTDLAPGNVAEYYIELQKDGLDSNTQTIPFSSSILVKVKNYNNGSMIVKSLVNNLLSEKFLPATITVE